jgi:hypothetical protein
MWLITPTGFYSIVSKPGDAAAGQFTIRARVRADLDALRSGWLPALTATHESTDTDYRFRATAPQADVAAAVARMVASIDYSNFKDEVAERQGSARVRRYHDVWAALLPLQHNQQGRR